VTFATDRVGQEERGRHRFLRFGFDIGRWSVP
jgi:hypothetical protein